MNTNNYYIGNNGGWIPPQPLNFNCGVPPPQFNSGFTPHNSFNHQPMNYNPYHGYPNNNFRNNQVQQQNRPFNKYKGRGGGKQRNNSKQNNNSKDNFIAFCETCDRGFKTEDKKKEHYSQHTPCDVNGCKFEAHFKIVEIHKRNFHGKFAAKLKFDTEEDIRKWREERRKNFPTAANIERKKLQQTDRINQGNILNTKQFGKRKQKQQNKHNNSNKMSKMNLTKETPAPIQLLFCSNMNGKNDSTINSDTLEIKSDTEKDYCNEASKPTVTSALTSILQNYDTDESEVGEEIDIPEPVKAVSPPKKGGKKSNKNTKNKGLFSPIKRKDNLLEMLLAPDIRKERNEILQCVRFIVINNFFQGK